MPRDAIEDWLSILQREATERGAHLDTDIDGRIFHFELGETDPVLGKIRISDATKRNYEDESGESHIWQRFNREQEKLKENPDQRVCTIQLDIQQTGGFDPHNDHFLFIPGELILSETYSKGDQKIKITGPGEYEGPLAQYVNDWDALFEYATDDLRMETVDETQVEARLSEFTDAEDEAADRVENPDPAVWVEKTRQEGRPYKQEGELALGSAIFSPSEDKAGRKRYETLRDAAIGDVVLHLLQETEQIVGVSRIVSELHEDFSAPPAVDRTPQQEAAGGYMRRLEGYEELTDPVQIYDEVLNNSAYNSRLQRIRKQTDKKIFYSSNLSLNQGHYFTKAPPELLSVLVQESADLAAKLRDRGVTVPDPAQDPAEAYDSVTDAMADIDSRVTEPSPAEWFHQGVTTRLIEETTPALKGLEPGAGVTREEQVQLEHLKKLYYQLEERLQSRADDLGIGSLNQLSPAQTLFMYYIRRLQETHGETPNCNQVKLDVILNDAYDAETQPADQPVTGHAEELIGYLEELPADKPVWAFTAPPEYWLTAIQYGVVSFEEAHQDRWERISEGTIALLHSRADPAHDSIPSQPHGIIGVAILGTKAEKDELWWGDETEAAPFPYIMSFDRLFLTGTVAKLDLVTSVAKHASSELVRQFEYLTANVLPYDEVNAICKAVNGRGFPAQGAHARLRTDDGAADHERPQAILEALAGQLTEVGTINAHTQFTEAVDDDILEGLYFPDDQEAQLLTRIETALQTGKHIILTGPPGTGKTELARQIAAHLTEAHPYLYSGFELTTATADWSTFDTVGGYMPDDDGETNDQLTFTPGIVLNRFKHHGKNIQLNEPLVIDELNRADIDKSFGQLFTLLSGQSVQLPFRKDGAEVELLNAEDTTHPPASHQYIVPESWRLFATMNTYDKTSLYEMSYAFMRRFAFIPVPAPTLPADTSALEKELEEYASVWEINADADQLRAVGTVWRHMNTAVENRAIGPAIIKDVLAYVAAIDDNTDQKTALTEAVISYIYPQLEGVPKRDQIVDEIAKADGVDENMLRTTATDMLQVSFQDNEPR